MIQTKPIIPEVAHEAVRVSDSRQAVYSRYISILFHHSGKMTPGFNNKDLQKWIDENYPGLFDEKGKKVKL